MEQLLQLRNDPVTYEWFCTNFLPIIVEQTKFNRYVHTYKISEFASPCDEAVALVMIENSEDRWKYEADQIKQGVKVANEKEKKDKRPKTRYTWEGTNWIGWYKYGVPRYMELTERIAKERQQQHAKTWELQEHAAFIQNLDKYSS